MIYPPNCKVKLGFDLIEERLSNFCASELGRNKVMNLHLITSKAKLKLKLQQVEAIMGLMQKGSIPGLNGVSEIEDLLSRSRIKGNWLTGLELYQLLKNLEAAITHAAFLKEATKEYNSLQELQKDFKSLHLFEKKLRGTVDEEGNILDAASPELKKIRRQLTAEEGSLRKKVNAIFRQAKTDGHIPEGSSVGVRDGRMVIPVIASNKNQVKGFIHDESASGNIVFMEPAMVLDANNKIRELQLAEAREIRNILVAITGQVGDNAEILSETTKFLGEMDLLIAKARLARALDGHAPVLEDKGIQWRQLRHPFLVLLENDRHVVDHQVVLNEENKFLLISGPNAGGKSVAMKSIGLNQMMLQHGLLPCCHPDSSVRLFEGFFIDIGDEQSIDNDLSTYSSHLINMREILQNANENSLVLIDEFGSGTDPSFGGAIAEAILRQMLANGSFGVITTHFSNLKLFADRTVGITNGAMLFDAEHLEPLYQLDMGRPGSSFSLEVAKAAGLPSKVLDIARQNIGEEKVGIEKLLGSLETEKRKFEEQNKKLVAKEKEISALKDEYTLLKQELKEKKRDIINLAREEASHILSKTNKEIEKTIRHIRENKAEKKETKKIRESLTKYAGKVKPKLNKSKPAGIEVVPGIIEKGDRALVKGRDVVVEVLEVKGKKAKVLIGELQSVVALADLQKISRREAKKKQVNSSKSSVNSRMNQIMADFTPLLDVRGMRASEVLPALQKFLDEAVMLNQNSLKVIHGRGNGVLRELVRQELKQWPQVLDFEYEHAERGGDGATLVKLK